MTFPIPSKIRPTISSDTFNDKGFPLKRTFESRMLMPLGPSKICTIALSSCTSST